MIFATGDIAHGGKPSEYEVATQFFDQLLEAVGLTRRELFTIPGNHDVDRDLGLRLARTLESREEAVNAAQIVVMIKEFERCRDDSSVDTKRSS